MKRFLPLILLGVLSSHPAFPEEPSYPDVLIRTARERRLAQDRAWQLLLHEKKNHLGFSQSTVDGPGFFLSPKGKSDPESELEATLRAFFEPGTQGDGHPQCRFPARYEWLDSQLNFNPKLLPQQDCPRLEQWRSDWRNANSLTLVFASAYLNNPASMYGHTFLRVNQKNRPEGERLLDYSVNFAADTPERNGVLFAAKGLIGSYPGRFTTTPYYFKVQQYSNIESRDLWEYNLAMTPPEIRSFTNHLWELGETYFDYYFLTENCSYQLLPMLETARPSLNLSDPFDWKVIPTDTVRAVLSQPGLVSARRLRPSTLRLVLTRRARLSPQELREAEAIAQRKDLTSLENLKKLSPESQARILESAYDYFRYLHGFQRFQPKDLDQFERELLVRRGALKVVLPDPAESSFPDASPPEAGHKTSLAGLSLVRNRNESLEELSLRGALHELISDPKGYVPFSQLEMFHLILRHDNDSRKTRVEKMTFADIVSLTPWDRWIKRSSWRISTGFAQAKDLGREPLEALHYTLNGGTGFAWESKLWRSECFFAMAEGDLGVGGVFRDSYRAGGGGSSGLLIEWAPWWRSLFEAGFLRYPLGDVRSVTKTAATQNFTLTQNTEARARFERAGPSQELSFTLNLFF